MGTDVELLRQWCDGDQLAGKALCARHFDEIYRFFEHKIPDEADDLTQQTFLACVRSRSTFRGESSFRTYLFAIARNEFYMRLRRAPRGEHVDLEVSSLDELVSSPSQKLREQQALAVLHAALRQLPVEQQVLLEFHYWHDLNAAELAELLETSAVAVRGRLLRARNALRKRLAGTALDEHANDEMSKSLLSLEAEDSAIHPHNE